MKRCPTCKRTFDDDSLSFCLEDGTPLVTERSAFADSEATLVSPSPPSPRETAPSVLPPTQAYNQSPAGAMRFDVPVAPSQRKIWPWVVGILAILFLAIVAIVVAAVAIPALMHGSRDDNKPTPTPTRPTSPTPESSPSASESENDVPTDEDEVLSQLTSLEKDWTEANIKGDKEALDKILATEYAGGANSHTKQEYINSLEPDPSVQSYELQNLTVELNGDRATMEGDLKEETTRGTELYHFVDTFVWRDHRWQAVASRATRVK